MKKSRTLDKMMDEWYTGYYFHNKDNRKKVFLMQVMSGFKC